MALASQERMYQDGLKIREAEAELSRKQEEKIKRLSEELAIVKADVVSKDVALSSAEEALKAAEAALEGKEVMMNQYVMDAGNMGDYYSQDARIQMMEEFNSGDHEAWDVEEAKRQIAEDFPEGAPGDALMAEFLKLRGPSEASLETSPEATPSGSPA